MLILPRVSPWGWQEGLAHDLQIWLQILWTRFHNKCSTKYRISTYKTPFQASECYSPTSSQARVLVIQASVPAYLQDLPSGFFSYDSLNTRKWRNHYWRATYEDNFATVLNQEFLFFCSQVAGFASNPSCLNIGSCVPFSTRKPYAKGVPEKDYLMQQKQYQQRTTLRTWPC